MNIRNLLGILLLIILALGAYIYFFIYHQSHPDFYHQQADHKVEAVQLFTKFQADEQKANELYLGKVLRVTGVILDLEIKNGEIDAIRLDAGEILDGLVCELDKIYPRETSDLGIGDSIVIQGVCTGFLQDVILNRCSIIEMKSN